MASSVTVFEVGVRDGLQNEPRAVSTSDKIELIQGLVDSGVTELELGAFVRTDRVPQMADTDQIYQAIQNGKLNLNKARAWSLVPNLKGLERAISVGVKQIAVFTAATESFAQKNIGMSIDESLVEFAQVIKIAKKNKIKVRGYVSTAFACPFEGKVAPKQALKVVERLAELGVSQVSIGDTIGVATPIDIEKVIRPVMKMLPRKQVAVHLHDTRGTALANTLRALDLGVTTVDSSAAGLGGCPFAPGAAGNLATEDLVYMLHGLGVSTGIDLNRLCENSARFMKKIGRPVASRYLQAYLKTCEN